MFDITALQRELAAVYAPSGFETALAERISELARPFADEVRTDALGNLIVRKKGGGAKLMLAAHMDSLALAVTRIDDYGYLRFCKIGGLRPERLIGTLVEFKNGTKGAVMGDPLDGDKKHTLDDLFIDICARDAAEARERVNAGDFAVFRGETYAQNGRLVSKYLDDRIGCAVLLKVLESLENPVNDVYFAFTVQEEVGCRGARTAAYGIDPDYCVAVDVTGAWENSDVKRRPNAELGAGAAVCYRDASLIPHPKVTAWLEREAAANGIKIQRSVSQGGTDAGAAQFTRSGVPSGVLSVPTRYVHSAVETADLADIEAVCALARRLCVTEPD